METKFDFSEEETTGASVQKDAKGFLVTLSTYLKGLLDFRKDIDKATTIQAIQEDIPVKGATVWVLMCSIFVASAGLNADSSAVVIGAMLISPLMGPILGVGLSIATNDIDTLKKSLINFSAMVVLSILTAYLFFALFQLSESSSELLARTRPTIQDVLIAFFGGLALIIARTKKGTIASVIFGVAIATALMPPLCTIGYGLASGKFSFAFGALYLFTINSIFIALATYVVLRVLRFPMTKYANSKKRRLIARVAYLVALLVMVPTAFTFMDVVVESRFKAAARNFISQELNGLANAEYLQQTAQIHFNHKAESKDLISFISNTTTNEKSRIVLNTFGLNPLPKEVIDLLNSRLIAYPVLSNTTLEINQQKRSNQLLVQQRYMNELRYRDSLDLLTKTKQIALLTSRIGELESTKFSQIDFLEINQEVRIFDENITRFAFANTFISSATTLDTVPVFSVQWDEKLSIEDIAIQENKLKKWLAFKLQNQAFDLNRLD
jgi:uncharacterized hydrophobic protein (TIGR00271 family)